MAQQSGPSTDHVDQQPSRWRLNRVGAAVEQLEWAIELLVRHDAPLPAITLAGAAEELVGKRVHTANAMALLKSRLVERCPEVSPDAIGHELNQTKNWLKHGSGADTHDVDLEAEAVQLIARALTNISKVGGPRTPMEPLFMDWCAGRQRFAARTPDAQER